MADTRTAPNEPQPSMLATVEQDWALVEALPPNLPAELLPLDVVDEATTMLESRYTKARRAESRDTENEARLAFWLGSLQFDRAVHPDTPSAWRAEYFEDGLIYLNQVRESEGLSPDKRNQASLLGTTIRLQQLRARDAEPTDSTAARYGKHLARIASISLQNDGRTKVARTEELLDAALPLLLTKGGLIPLKANARERCDLPTPHPRLHRLAHQQYIFEDVQKIGIKAVFHGRDGRANGIPGQLACICFQSLARHHLRQNSPQVYGELASRRQIGNISFRVLSWAVRSALNQPLRPEEVGTVNALGKDILDRVQEIVLGKRA